MKTNELLELLKNKKDGINFTIEYIGDLPLNAVSKKAGINAYKITTATVQKGIRYTDLQSVKDKLNEGFELSHELPWGNWKPGYEGLLIEHKDTDYIRLYPVNNSFNTKYFINNKEVDFDKLKESGYLVNSFFNKKDGNVTDVITVKVGNITTVY